MSGAAAPLVGKVLTGAIIGKTVGNVTGNDKLGMVAALMGGSMLPGVPTEGVMEKTGGLLEKTADWASENPMQAKIAGKVAGGAAIGAANTLAAKKEAEAAAELQKKKHRQELEMLEEKKRMDEEKYQREHQGFNPVAPSRFTGLLTTPADTYYNQFKSLYSGGVR